MIQLPAQIVIYPNPVLRAKTALVPSTEIPSEDIQALAQHMIQKMYDAHGVGLAAPQLGISKRITVIDAEDGKGPRVLINPVITKHSRLKTTAEEGCLSLPQVFGSVARYRKITVEYTDLEGNNQSLNCHPFLARVVQHELDHLDGVLFIDKLAGPLHTGAELLAAWDRGEKPIISIPYPYTY